MNSENGEGSRPYYRGRDRGGGRGFRGSTAHDHRGRGGQISRTNKNFVYEYNDDKVLRWNNVAYVSVEPSSAAIVDNFSKSIKVIGSYSEDAEKNFSLDKSSLLFLRTELLPDEETRVKNVKFDLKDGASKVTQYTGKPIKTLHNILSWIVSNKETFRKEKDLSAKSSGNDGQFICQKNVLSSMVHIPYRYSRDFEVFAVTISNFTFILRGNDINLAGVSPINSTASIWAHNFEKIMTRENYNPVIHCNEDYRVVLSANLDGHNLFYAAATDCANPELYDEDMEDMSAFVGLKTLPELINDAHTSNFARFKVAEYYFYSLLLGIDNIIVGFKSEDGIVSMLQRYNKQELQKIGENMWHPVISVTFASKLLSFIKKNCGEAPGKVFRFKKEARSNEVICTEDDDLEQPIPDWFFEELQDNYEE